MINEALLSTPPPPLAASLAAAKLNIKQEAEEKETAQTAAEAKEPILTEPPEHLPPKQRELFLRIQQQQLKHENKVRLG